METGGRRRKGQRILYYFRTPPSVRVGREAIDAEAIRLLEQHNPDVTFDWGRLLKTGPSNPQPAPDERRPRRERRDPRQREQGRPSPSAPPRPQAPPRDAEPFEPAEPDETGDATDAFEFGESPLEAAEPETAPAPEPEPEMPVDVPERYARLGADGLSRLRARYADIAVRLAARPMEEAERTDLLARAEQLNPDAWTTPDEVTAALEAYEAVFESLRSVVGRRRS